MLVAVCWGLSVGALILALAVMLRVRTAEIEGVGALQSHDIIDLVAALAMVTLGAAIVMRGRPPGYGWVLLITGLVLALAEASSELALHGWYLGTDPESAPVGVAIFIQDLGLAVLASIVLLVPSLFPDGRPPAGLGRSVKALAIGWLVWLVGFALIERQASNMFDGLDGAPDNPLGFIPVALEVADLIWILLVVLSFVTSVRCVRQRWRCADGDVRQQLKWVLFALAVLVATILASVAVPLLESAGVNTGLKWIQSTMIPLAVLGVVMVLGLSVLRYRLYDADLVINRTVVFVAMSAVVMVGYAVAVVAAPRVIPGISGSGASVLAAGAVAVVFAPIRAKVQVRVDKRFFGQRSDPYAVLSEVGAAVAEAGGVDDSLRSLNHTVTVALKLPGAAITMSPGEPGRVRVGVGELGSSPFELPLRYQGRTVGCLQAARRSPGERLHADDVRLLESVAQNAAALIHTTELSESLQKSREQLVIAREEERRRLRRDLHDGLGPTLASQTFRLDAALSQIREQPQVAEEQLRLLKQQNTEIVGQIRRLVNALRPPTLDELGLVEALRSQASPGAMDLAVSTQPDPLGDLPAAVESAAYLIASEAITNASRHSDAQRCDVWIERDGSELLVRVCDNGVGIGPDASPGVGMSSMRERALELGGNLALNAGPSGGTEVVARLPLGPVGVENVRPNLFEHAHRSPTRERRSAANE